MVILERKLVKIRGPQKFLTHTGTYSASSNSLKLPFKYLYQVIAAVTSAPGKRISVTVSLDVPVTPDIGVVICCVTSVL